MGGIEPTFVSEVELQDVRLIRQSLWRLHKLLTDLPDDMLEDSHDSLPDVDDSTYSPQKSQDRPQHIWNGQQHPPPSQEDRTHGWETQQDQNYQYESGEYVYSNGINESNTFSAEEGYQREAYTHAGLQLRAEYHGVMSDDGLSNQAYGQHTKFRNQFQNFETGLANGVDTFKATFQPHKSERQQNMFNVQPSLQNGHFDQLQREFLDSAPNTVDAQESAQLKILNKAQSRQIEDLEQKLEESRRKLRYLEHQFAIVKDEKDGLTLSLKESSHLLEEGKKRDSQLQDKVRSLEKQVQSLTEREQEYMRKQCAADAAVDSMKQQMTELCRSDTLTRAREQHDRDIASMREQHDAQVLILQQKLDSNTQSMEEQVQATQRLGEKVRQMERQREEEQVDRAAIVNALSQRLEESQQQCAKLLQTGSMQEVSQLQMKLQQVQSSRNISENMNKALQEELNELKEHITLYEAAVKLGAISLDSSPDWENQLSESYVDLGIKKVKWKNTKNHSPLLSDSSQPKEDLLKELKTELQRCLAQLKSKREKITQLQQEVRMSQNHVEQLQNQLQGAERTAKDSVVRENSLEKLLELSNKTPHEELVRLEEERQQLQKTVQALEVQNKELKQSEEKVKAANSELCTKMREMIHELDQEKQEAAERYERTQQQYRDDVVQRVRAELTQEHKAHMEQLAADHQQKILQLQAKLKELSQEVLAVQEFYISVCKEKDRLEETLQSKFEEEKKLREEEMKIRQDTEAVLEKQKADLISQHQEAVEQLKAQWTDEKKTEIQKQLDSFKESCVELERKWAHRLEEVMKNHQKASPTEAQDGSCQTDSPEPPGQHVSLEELEARLCAQRITLQREADTKLKMAVEEAVRTREGELQQEHVQNLTSQIETAVFSAQTQWLQNLTSFPEYQVSLKTERDQWEKLQLQYTDEQVTSAVNAAGKKWQETLAEKSRELEENLSRNHEQQVHSLQMQLERQREEQTALLKTELSAARAVWNVDKEEEMSCLRTQFQREQQNRQQKYQAQLERSIAETREEILRQSQALLQESLHNKEKECRSQEELRLKEERKHVQEMILAELKEVLNKLQDGTEERESRDDSLKARLGDLCRKTLLQTVASTKQEWVKISEEKLRLVLKETQEQHEKELHRIRNSSSHRQEGVCNSKNCNESISKLQKKSQELQRHLEKACRQLQHTVRENKSTLHKLKEEHEVTLCKERQAHAKALEETKASAYKESRGAVNQPSLQSGLEEMKEQYMKAVQKIRGDMLRYLQESKERAAEMIRAEVLRERQDTARRMRRYYLTCLQELLEEAGQTSGAEKKIINAASKLAAMAKVLETPVAKKKSQRNQHFLEPSFNPQSSQPGHEPKRSCALSGLSSSAETESVNKQIHQKDFTSETSNMDPSSNVEGFKTAKKILQPDMTVRSHGTNCSDVTDQRSPTTLHPPKKYREQCSTDHVTARKQSREMYLTGKEAENNSEHFTPQATVEPFMIKEAPVRDDGQSDWSLSSTGSNFTNSHLPSYLSQYPDPVSSCSITGRVLKDLDFGSSLCDNSDVTVYKEIAKKPSGGKPKLSHNKTSNSREPTPGSEEEKIHRLCPKSLFSEFKVFQQDSGFDTPLSRLQK